MLRVIGILPAGHWLASARRDTVTLTFDDRFRRRIRLTGDNGLVFLLDLADATVLQHGDGLKLETGGIVEVRAAEESLVEVTAADAGALARLAWHLGNRHLPAEIADHRILIRDDHVIVDMLKGLGATVRHVSAPFNPEGGAYGQHNHDTAHPHAHGHHHHHHDDHDHGHDHHHHD
jgi:urease accessory protein